MSTQIVALDQQDWDLVRSRIDKMLPKHTISIGGIGEFDKNDLIRQIEDKTDVGELIVNVYLNYLKSFSKEFPI